MLSRSRGKVTRLAAAARAIAAGLVSIGLIATLTGPASAGHGEPPATTIEGAVCLFVADLDDLIEEAGLTVGDFEEPRLNRSLAKAKAALLEAREAAAEPDLVASFRDLKSAMRWWEVGAALPVSGNGFADDLASLGSFYEEVFVLDLITVAADVGAANTATIAEASAHYDAGVAHRVNGEWRLATADFLKALKVLPRGIGSTAAC